ncbi:unnamed protein product [Rhodiola kirilowii]
MKPRSQIARKLTYHHQVKQKIGGLTRALCALRCPLEFDHSYLTARVVGMTLDPAVFAFRNVLSLVVDDFEF